MYIIPSILTLASVLFSGLVSSVTAQAETDRKVRIEVITTEDGKTRTITKEFDTADDAMIQEALREMGVLDHFSLDGRDGHLRIDIRDFDGVQDLDRPFGAVPDMAPFMGLAEGQRGAWLGVSTSSMDAQDQKGKVKEGAVVQHVSNGSPAAAVGLQQGDVITLVDKTAITGPGELANAIRTHSTGDEVKLTWYRDGKKMTGTATLAERSLGSHFFDLRKNGPDGAFSFPMPDTKRAFLGVTPAESEEGLHGVKIHSVEEGSAAATMGIQPGDVVRRINGQEVATFAALADRIKRMAPGDAVAVELERGGRTMEVNGTLGERKGWSGGRSFQFDGLDPEMHEEMRRELDKLRLEFDHLRDELGRGGVDKLRREMRITIQGRPLDQAEKDLLTKNGVTGLDKELELGDLSCFPNPSSGFFRLHFDVPERGDLTVHIHNSTGERIYDERIGAFKGRYERTLDLGEHATGTYYLVIGQNGRTATQKLVKQ